MAVFVALLRAVNVGGTGKLPMADLRALCADAGFRDARTYIQSGNVVFDADAREREVKAALEVRLADFAKNPVAVAVRSAAAMQEVVAGNPFPAASPSRTVAIFLDAAPAAAALEQATGRRDEEMALGRREIFVAYGAAGIGRSKLRIPAARAGTARNLKTVARLAQMAQAFCA